MKDNDRKADLNITELLNIAFDRNAVTGMTNIYNENGTK